MELVKYAETNNLDTTEFLKAIVEKQTQKDIERGKNKQGDIGNNPVNLIAVQGQVSERSA